MFAVVVLVVVGGKDIVNPDRHCCLVLTFVVLSNWVGYRD